MLKRIGGLIGQTRRANFTPFVSSALGLTAAAHLNFIDRRYYADGKEFREGAFATFTGATFGTGDEAGLTGTGTATDHDITLNWADLNITAPFVVAVVFRPALINGTVQTIISLDAETAPSQNRTTFTVHSTNGARNATTVANVAQSSQVSSALSVDTNYAMAGLVKTDLFRSSLNGATVGTEDTSGTLPDYSLIRFLEIVSGFPFTGAIRHVLFFQQTGGAEISQADLNTLSAELALI